MYQQLCYLKVFTDTIEIQTSGILFVITVFSDIFKTSMLQNFDVITWWYMYKNQWVRLDVCYLLIVFVELLWSATQLYRTTDPQT